MPSIETRLRRIEGLLRDHRRKCSTTTATFSVGDAFPVRGCSVRARKVFEKLFSLHANPREITVGDVLRLGADKFYEQKDCGVTTINEIAAVMRKNGATSQQVDRWLETAFF